MQPPSKPKALDIRGNQSSVFGGFNRRSGPSQSSSGFTLIELVVAIAVAAMLATGVWSSLVSASQLAERRKADADALSARLRAIELLREDFRGRVSGRERDFRAVSKDGAMAMAFTTTTDSLASGGAIRLTEVTYGASPSGLRREEASETGSVKMSLLKELVIVEFGGFRGWRRDAGGDEIQALRLTFKNPDEIVVIR